MAVVEGERQRHHVSRHHLVLNDPRPPRDLAHTQNRGLAGVDDRRTAVDTEDTDVGDGEGAAGLVGRLGTAGAGGGGQFADGIGSDMPFLCTSYQQFFGQLRAELGGEHRAYLDYVTRRYCHGAA
jgi:hypothetical protein